VAALAVSLLFAMLAANPGSRGALGPSG
jgi:hypothetical protein